MQRRRSCSALALVRHLEDFDSLVVSACQPCFVANALVVPVSIPDRIPGSSGNRIALSDAPVGELARIIHDRSAVANDP